MEIENNPVNQGPIEPELIKQLFLSGSDFQEIGAHTLFLGKVRADTIKGKKVKKIVYSAYEDMVVDEIRKIRNEIMESFDDVQRVVIRHSVGEVNVGEISFLVFVASGHRDHAFKASQAVVEKIKERLPVWKKEIFEDDTHQWKETKSFPGDEKPVAKDEL